MGFPWFRTKRGDNTNSTAVRPVLDFHNHLLPGVDDGMESYEDAVGSIAALRALGFAGAVLTPHIYRDVFDNSSASLRAAFAGFVERLAYDGVAFPLTLAGEYFADEHLIELIERDDLLFLTVGAERWVLLEFPTIQETPFAGVCMAALAARGYRPVVAHVERYRWVAQEEARWFARFAQAGAILQGDIGSLAGQHGEEVRRFAARLAARGAVAIWGTDIHNHLQIERHIGPGLARLGAVGRLNSLLEPLMTKVAA